MNPPSLPLKLTWHSDEILVSSRLVAKHSLKPSILLLSDQIMQESNFPLYLPVPEHQLPKLLLKTF